MPNTLTAPPAPPAGVVPRAAGRTGYGGRGRCRAALPFAVCSGLFAPLILLNSTDKFTTTTLAVVNTRAAGRGWIDYAALEAGVVFMAVPCLLLFGFMQRSHVRGFISGALNG